MTTYALNEEQRQIQDMVRRLAREKVAARADQIDRSAEYPQDMFNLLREVGLFTIPFPKGANGSNTAWKETNGASPPSAQLLSARAPPKFTANCTSLGKPLSVRAFRRHAAARRAGARDHP